jgi:hypothetical protein
MGTRSKPVLMILCCLFLIVTRFSGIYNPMTRSLVPQLHAVNIDIVDSVAGTQLWRAAQLARSPHTHSETDLTWALRVLRTVGHVGNAAQAAIFNITHHLSQFSHLHHVGGYRASGQRVCLCCSHIIGHMLCCACRFACVPIDRTCRRSHVAIIPQLHAASIACRALV